MNQTCVKWIALPSFLLVTACSSGNSGGPGAGGSGGGAAGTGGGGSQPLTCSGASFSAKDANDYSFSSTITLPPVTVKPQTNLTFTWGNLSKDFLGHAVDPKKDLDYALLMLWNMPLADLQTMLNADTLDQNDLETPVPPTYPLTGTMATSEKLYDFTVQSMPLSSDAYNMYFDPSKYPSSKYSYVVAVQTGKDLGKHIRMLQSFQLDSGSSATTVELKNDSTKLTYSANLHSLTPTGVPANTAALTLDFGQLSKNALGATNIDPTQITSAIVGHYTQTPAQLEAQFLDLDSIATDYYTAKIEMGTTLDFTTLKDKSGTSFPGVDNTGTWLVGLICDGCRNPAPWYMTILKPCSM